MKVIDDFLDALADGQEHSYTELQSKTGLSEKKVDMIARLFTAYGIATLCVQTNKLKLSPSMVEFWNNIKAIE